MQNLKVGSKGNTVKDLQTFLKGVGLYTGAIDGDYGPKTLSAVQQFQGAQGIKTDGIVGPITQGKIQAYTVLNHPAVQDAMKNDPGYAATMNKIFTDPALSKAASAAYDMLDSGSFTPEEYGNQYKDQYSALDTYYKENQLYGTNTAKNSLDTNAANYARDTATDVSNFKTDKGNLDKNAADNGVLFSTGRMQNETGLQNKYSSAAEARAAALKSNNGTILNDYEYKYGAPAASTLSSYMTAPAAPTFNAGTPENNVTPGGIKSIYAPNNYYGTQNTAEQTAAAGNTNSYFKNVLNKSNTEGYNTKI